MQEALGRVESIGIRRRVDGDLGKREMWEGKNTMQGVEETWGRVGSLAKRKTTETFWKAGDGIKRSFTSTETWERSNTL
jgi:hypothetical protein